MKLDLSFSGMQLDHGRAECGNESEVQAAEGLGQVDQLQIFAAPVR